jgi:hypothetical protein
LKEKVHKALSILRKMEENQV